MKKEGNKMETHQIWIKASNKTHKRSKSDLEKAKRWPAAVVIGGGGGGFV